MKVVHRRNAIKRSALGQRLRVYQSGRNRLDLIMSVLALPPLDQWPLGVAVPHPRGCRCRNRLCDQIRTAEFNRPSLLSVRAQARRRQEAEKAREQRSVVRRVAA